MFDYDQQPRGSWAPFRPNVTKKDREQYAFFVLSAPWNYVFFAVGPLKIFPPSRFTLLWFLHFVSQGQKLSGLPLVDKTNRLANKCCCASLDNHVGIERMTSFPLNNVTTALPPLAEKTFSGDLLLTFLLADRANGGRSMWSTTTIFEKDPDDNTNNTENTNKDTLRFYI